MKKILILISLILFVSCNSSKSQTKQVANEDYNIDYSKYIKKTGKAQKFKKDLVVNEEMAKKLADLYWDIRFGTTKGVKDLPYTITLEENKVWYVKTNLPEGYVGRIFYIKINKYDGRVLYIWSEG